MATLEQEASADAPRQSGPRRGRRTVTTLIVVLGILAVAVGGTFGGIWVRSAIARHRAVSRFDARVAAHNAAVARHETALSEAQQALAQTAAAGTRMSRAQAALNQSLNASGKRMNSCSSARCFDALNVADARAAAAFGRAMEAGAMGAGSVPAGASALARRLAAETAGYQKSWTYMSHATSLTDVEHRARRSEQTERQFYAADQALAQWLKDQAAALRRREAALDQQAAALDQSGVALRQQSETLGVQADIRTARLSQEPVTSAA